MGLVHILASCWIFFVLSDGYMFIVFKKKAVLFLVPCKAISSVHIPVVMASKGDQNNCGCPFLFTFCYIS